MRMGEKTAKNHPNMVPKTEKTRLQEAFWGKIAPKMCKLHKIIAQKRKKFYDFDNKKILQYCALCDKIYKLDMRRSERLPKAWRPTGNFRGVCPFDRAKRSKQISRGAGLPLRYSRILSWQMLMRVDFGFLIGERKNARRGVGLDRAPGKRSSYRMRAGFLNKSQRREQANT